MTAARKLMTPEEFLVWRLDQEGTWELVNGVPQLKFYNGPNMLTSGWRTPPFGICTAKHRVRLRRRA